MADSTSILAELVRMSNDLGRPERDLVILGEGNTSAVCEDGTFYVKASGTELRTIDAQGFVRLRADAVCALADREGVLPDAALKAALDAAKVDPSVSLRPSVETVLHALALTEGGAKFVGHTHPAAVNALMCSVAAPYAISGRLFPDEIVVCGPAPVYIPYTDPGLPLARVVRAALKQYRDEWGQPAKVVLMQNHGLIALGSSAREVDAVTSMYVKTCRVLAGAYAFGGPHFMTTENVEAIHKRPDEGYRRKALGIT
jgi:rhamnose utilization protein RhaD (predicted bifunctional aldolase and dehydrogenase)